MPPSRRRWTKDNSHPFASGCPKLNSMLSHHAVHLVIGGPTAARVPVPDEIIVRTASVRGSER